LCESETKTIYLDRVLKLEERPRVFLHELFHALCFELKMHNAMSDEVEELLADNLSYFLLDKFTIRLKRK
jgi:hypothetical protein